MFPSTLLKSNSGISVTITLSSESALTLVMCKILSCEKALSETSPSFPCLHYKSFENSVGKGEIARNEQFLFFPAVFSAHLDNFPPFSSRIVVCKVLQFGRV